MKIFLFFIFYSLTFVFLVGALAQDSSSYSFGSMQSEGSFSIKPGQEAKTKLYFYNIYGNKPTHIKLRVAEKPENWQVIINPDAKSKKYEVSGQIVEVDENLAVYPSNTSSSSGENTDTMDYISSSVGYIGANFVSLTFKIPKNEKIGVSKNVKINAVASWLGQGGNVDLQQERDFQYSINTITEYYEKPLENQAKIGISGKSIAEFFSFQTQIKPVYMIGTGTTLVLLILFAVLLVITIRHNRRNKNRKYIKYKKFK